MNDSDDLFGGLPAVANAENAAATATIAPPINVDLPAPVPSDVEKSSSSSEAEKRKGGASLISSLGSAGTAMAFVPHAIRRKKNKVKHQTSQSEEHKAVKVPKSVAREDLTGSQSQPEISAIKTNGDQPGKAPEMHESSKMAPAEITTWKHLTDNESSNESNNDTNPNNNNVDEAPYIENEPESLRLLHASVTQMYDPYFPNDYLAHRERKRSEEVRKELQRTALQRLDMQENLRKKIEDKRKKLLESGNFQGLVEEEMSSRRNETDVSRGSGGAGMGRGRGRGVMNLPAWLVKKQEEQQNEPKPEALGLDAADADGQFDDSAR